MYVVEAKNLTKKYGKLTAVNNVSFKIRGGEVFGLLGPNGAGKTTTLSMLATLVGCTSGDGYVDGHSIKAEPAKVRRSIGMVFQDPSSDDEEENEVVAQRNDRANRTRDKKA
jgi:ABC-2 type transport system ATP-binding protein